MKNGLSINGGGIRGIIPCSVLVALEQQTGKLTREIFSYVAGTSTGALLAAGVAAGVPASELLTVYTTPVVYLYVHRYWSKKKKYRQPTPPSLDAGGDVGPGSYGPAEPAT